MAFTIEPAIEVGWTGEEVLRGIQALPFVFQFDNGPLPLFFLFPVNPEAYTLQLPTRGSVVQTLAGNFENFFGLGVPKGQIRGTFGFLPRPQWGLLGLPLPGQAQVRLFEQLAHSFYNEAQSTIRQNDAAVNFYDIPDFRFLKVRLTSFSVERATSHQFLHHYSIEFLVLEDYLNPNKDDTGASNVLDRLATPDLFNDLNASTGDLFPATAQQEEEFLLNATAQQETDYQNALGSISAGAR